MRRGRGGRSSIRVKPAGAGAYSLSPLGARHPVELSPDTRLFSLGATATPDHRVFFALQPDAEAAGRIARLAEDLRRRHGLKGRPTPPARLHMSLNFVGTFRGPPTRAVMEKAAALADKVSAHTFVVSLNQIASWKGETPPLVLTGDEGVIGAELLHTAIHKALVAGTMAPRREPEIQPHVSLLWDKAVVPRTFVDPISWTAREFVLLDSVSGEGRHELLGRWALAGG